MNRFSVNAASAAGEMSQSPATATSRELSREEAEERRWQLEWDRRNVED